MSDVITANMVLDDLKGIVAEFGTKYVYPEDQKVGSPDGGTCVYVIDGTPACIVGQVLARRNRLAVSGIAAGNENAGLLFREGFTPEAARVLAVAQAVQDEGGTWGLALVAARSARDFS